MTANMPDSVIQGSNLRRVVGNLSVRAVTQNAVMSLSAGIAIIEEDALAALAVPDPGSTDYEFRWLWYHGQDWQRDNEDSRIFQQIPIDIKPSRRMLGRMAAVLIVFNAAFSGGNIDVAFQGRILLQK